jgi:3-oxoacyl-[acyl-carrier protein] reductase
MRRLEGKVLVVTGGSRGLGRAICLEAAREGAKVIVGFRRREREAREVEAEVQASGGQADVMALDVRDAAGVESAFSQVEKRHGAIELLVTSAGIVSDGWLATTPTEVFRDVVATNLDGTMHAIRAVLRGMIGQKKGSIVALASVAALRASPGQAAYAASKGAIVSLVRTVAAEVGPRGVRVNVVAPGVIDAGMVKATSKERIAAYLPHVPLGRLGKDEEVARATTFLLSDDASYITGQTLVVDGGLSL